MSVETNSVHRELKSRKEKVIKQLTIHKYLHIQFIKLGFVVGFALVLLGAFAAFEGIKLTQYEAEKYNTSQGLQITLTIALVSVVVIHHYFDRQSTEPGCEEDIAEDRRAGADYG